MSNYVELVADRNAALSLEDNKNYRYGVVKDEIRCLYEVMDFVFNEYEQMLSRRMELLNEDKDITGEDMAQLLLLGHLIELYRGLKK